VESRGARPVRIRCHLIIAVPTPLLTPLTAAPLSEDVNVGRTFVLREEVEVVLCSSAAGIGVLFLGDAGTGDEDVDVGKKSRSPCGQGEQRLMNKQ
jgi:hypothetical protein